MRHKITLVCASLLLAALVGAAPHAAEDPVIFTFNGEAFHQSDVYRQAAAYADKGVLSSDTDYEGAINYYVEDYLVPRAKARELGLDTFTPEEMAEMEKAAAEFFDAQVEVYVDFFASSRTDEEKEQFRQELLEYWTSIGTDEEAAREAYIFEKTKERLMAAMQVTVTEEEISATFDEQTAKDEAYFADNIPAYEFYTYYQNGDVWYVPEGARLIDVITLKGDEALINAYQDAIYHQDDIFSAGASAAEAVLSDRADTLKALTQALSQESFSEAAGRFEESGREDAWEIRVYENSTLYSKELVSAAFSEELKAPGDISSPFVDKDGIHILYYKDDVPGGIVPMDERIHDSIASYLTNQKQAALIREWAKQYELVIDRDALNAMRGDRQPQND